MLIPGSAIIQDLRGLEFPVEIWSQDWSTMEALVNRDDLIALADAGVVVGIGTRHSLRRIRLTIGLREAQQAAQQKITEKTRQLREELRSLRETRERSPGDGLFRMLAARKFIRREYLSRGGDWEGHWTWAHKRILV